MIECIFTIDYEIYGNGEGSLRESIYEPAEKLIETFRKWNARFVTFIEVAELEMIEAKGTDLAFDLVKQQIRNLYREGFELGLHVHPWWCNARYENREWVLDYSEYNLCALPMKRIIEIIGRSIAYLRGILNISDFTPLSYRAGHLLFQPARIVAKLLADYGIRLDSSVYKGGLWHQQKLDYRPAIRNGYYWRFTDDTNIPDPEGVLLELPIHTQMVPTWEMFTGKRIGIQQRGASAIQATKKTLSRVKDFLRLRRSLKLDFCHMTINELIRMVDMVIQEDREDPRSFRPIVAIGHTKDLLDFETVESFLDYLGRKGIKIRTFEEVYPKCT